MIRQRIRQSFEKLVQIMALLVELPSQAFPDLVAESVNAFLDRRLTLEQVIRELLLNPMAEHASVSSFPMADQCSSASFRAAAVM